ncbi:MAG: NUDIX domain-containing protein [Pseudolabrys sp.]|nr:NUDIX domain-containing protein [Pseudolabrys sp.]MBV9953748.1 NUDIX domain-containing protein [Pseudolabrys sp.]
MDRITSFRIRLEPVIRRIMHFYWRFSRGATLGVRAVIIDGENRVFLVKHGYVRGWHLPGGGVETGESFLEALKRELREEANIELSARPALHGIVHNEHVSKRDHVAVYVVRDFRIVGPPPRDGFEIIDSGFFQLDGLPEDCWMGTRARIEEVLSGKPAAERWLT